MNSSHFDENPQLHERAIENSIKSRSKKDSKAGLKQGLSKAMKNAFFDCPSRTSYQNKHINDATLDYIIKSMYDFHKDNTNFVMEFIDSQITEARSNPNSKAAERFRDILFTDALIQQMDEYLERSRSKDVDYYTYLIRSDLYDKQQAVFDDTGNKRHLIINSRRSGKTFLMGRLLAKAALEHPNSEIAYINRNSSAAIRQIKKPLTQALTRANLTIIKGSVEAQELTLSNGALILIIGNNNAGDVDKLRGESLACIIMDECGHQRNTRQLIREVVEPAMIDYGNESRLYMVGTPPRNKGTYVEDVYNHAIERGWKLWHWTFMDNPFIPDRESVIEEACKTNGVEKDSAFIRREYYGEMNAYDTDALWIKKYSEDKTIPNTSLLGYVGVDWGYEDKAAVVSIVASQQRGKGWIVDSWSESCKGITEISNEIVRQCNNLKEKYDLQRDPEVICDTNEKGAVWDLYSTYHLRNVFTAYKYDLDYAQDQLNELFSTNRLVIQNDPSGRVVEDIEKSLWKRDEETDKILHEIDDDIWHPNALMAIMYISRQFAFDVLGWIDHNKRAREIAAMSNSDVLRIKGERENDRNSWE